MIDSCCCRRCYSGAAASVTAAVVAAVAAVTTAGLEVRKLKRGRRENRDVLFFAHPQVLFTKPSVQP